MTAYDTRAMQPYGVELHGDGDGDPFAVDPDWLAATATARRLVLLRGFRRLETGAFVELAQRLGPLLAWNFGHVLELRIHAEPKNYLFTKGNVPYHWDGAFAATVPRFQIFQCLRSEGSGGETTFCDTVALLAQASADELRRWRGLQITYQTEQHAHYGGTVTAPLVSAHPITGEPTLRFAEPLNEGSVPLNPLELRIADHSASAQHEFLQSFIPRLYEPPFYYEHAWRSGDLLITDNHALLHGRTTLGANVDRHLQRIHVI